LALSKAEKEQIISEYMEKFSKSQALILADYRGMTVANLTRMRTQLRESSGAFMVVKNTLARIALERIGRAVPPETLTGTLAIGLCYKEIAPVAKVFNTMAFETKLLPMKGAILGNRLVNAAQAQTLSDMPSRDVLIAQVVGAVKSPLSNLVGVLSGPLQGFINVLQARADKLGAASAS
jgi:large subunit ribosomal protein L10